MDYRVEQYDVDFLFDLSDGVDGDDPFSAAERERDENFDAEIAMKGNGDD